MNLASLLVDHPYRDDEPLLHDVEHSLTAGQARSIARDTANQLEAAGLVAGDAVAVQRLRGLGGDGRRAELREDRVAFP